MEFKRAKFMRLVDEAERQEPKIESLKACKASN